MLAPDAPSRSHSLDPAIKQEWVKALRSDRYKQGRGQLLLIRNDERQYCCLGVLCDLLKVKNPNLSSYPIRRYDTYSEEQFSYGGYESIVSLPASLRHEINLSPSAQSELIRMNDADRKNFNQIADYIETNL